MVMFSELEGFGQEGVVASYSFLPCTDRKTTRQQWTLRSPPEYRSEELSLEITCSVSKLVNRVSSTDTYISHKELLHLTVSTVAKGRSDSCLCLFESLSGGQVSRKLCKA